MTHNFCLTDDKTGKGSCRNASKKDPSPGHILCKCVHVHGCVYNTCVFLCVCVLTAVNSLGPFKKQIRREVQTATQTQQRHRTKKKLNLHFLLFIHSACLVKRNEWGDVTGHTNRRTQRTTCRIITVRHAANAWQVKKC